MTMKMLTRQEVADLLGVKLNTVDIWRRRAALARATAKAAGKAEPPGLFPEPDDYLGATPWWKPSTIAKFRRNRRPSGRHGHTSYQEKAVNE